MVPYWLNQIRSKKVSFMINANQKCTIDGVIFSYFIDYMDCTVVFHSNSQHWLERMSH